MNAINWLRKSKGNSKLCLSNLQQTSTKSHFHSLAHSPTQCLIQSGGAVAWHTLHRNTLDSVQSVWVCFGHSGFPATVQNGPVMDVT